MKNFIECFIEEYKSHAKAPVLIPVVCDIAQLKQTLLVLKKLINLINLLFHFNENAENRQWVILKISPGYGGCMSLLRLP